MSRTILGWIVGALMVLSSSAQAAGLCSAGTATGGISEFDVRFTTLGTTVLASNCYGLAANAAETLSNYGLGSFTEVVSGSALQPIDIGAFGGLTFTLTTLDLGKASGHWTLTWLGSLPDTMDIVAVLQGSQMNQAVFASYLFSDLPSLGVLAGDWDANFGTLESPGSFSQFAIYAIKGSTTETPTTPVDEPDSVALLAVSILGLAYVVRRRRRR